MDSYVLGLRQSAPYVSAALRGIVHWRRGPNRKMKKEQAKFMESMKKGDEVVTNGGIVGKVTKIDEKTVTIETSPKNYMTVLLSSISKQLSEEYSK